MNLLPREPRVGFAFLARGGHSVSSGAGDPPGSSWVSDVPWVFVCPHLGQEVISSQGSRPLLEMGWLSPRARRTLGVDRLPRPPAVPLLPAAPLGQVSEKWLGAGDWG